MDIVISLSNKFDVSWKHAIEKELDAALVGLGFARSGSAVKEDGSMEIFYQQFGTCGAGEEQEPQKG
ncbi:MAG: hypothetical protein WC373_12135 [Smithella sp.]|jgi:hypothetical protein